MSSKILILGGTGSIGLGIRHRLLNDSSFTVTFTSRSPRSKFYNGESLIVGDAKNYSFLDSILAAENWDIVLDLMVYKAEQLNFILDQFLNSCGLYIFISSGRVYLPTDEPLNEESARLLDYSNDARYLRTREYALEKARQENLLFKNKNDNWLILRPYITFNKDRLQLGAYEKEDWLYRGLQRKSIPLPLELLERETTITSADEVAMLIYHLLKLRSVNADVFDVINPKATTWREILHVYERCIYEVTGITLNYDFLPAEELFICHRGKYQLTMDRLHNRRFSGEKIKSLSEDVVFSDPLIDLECKLKSFLEEPQFKKISYFHEGVKDRITKQPWQLGNVQSLKAKMNYLRGRIKY